MAVNAKSYTSYANNNTFPIYRELGKYYTGSIWPSAVQGACYLEKRDRGDRPGISLNVDFIGGSDPYQYSKLYFGVRVSIRKYSLSTGKWGGWTEVYNGAIKNAGPYAEELWNSNPRMPYGFVCGGVNTDPGSIHATKNYTKIFNNPNLSGYNPNYYYDVSTGGQAENWKTMWQMTYAEFARVCQRFAGYKKSLDQESYYLNVVLNYIDTTSEIGGEYVYYLNEPWGKRYLSNKGKWSKTKTRMQKTVSSSFSNYKFHSWDSIDGGAGSNLARIDVDSYAGESHWQLKFDVYNSGNQVSWLYPTDSSRTDINKIDNALLGIPDVQSSKDVNSVPVDWPPRYDAKFYKYDSGWKELTAAGKKSDGNNWSVF